MHESPVERGREEEERGREKKKREKRGCNEWGKNAECRMLFETNALKRLSHSVAATGFSQPK